MLFEDAGTAVEDASGLIVGRTPNGELSNRLAASADRDARLRELLMELLPKFSVDWGIHSLVALGRIPLSRILYYHEIYKQILTVPGVICEFGVQWGATMSILHGLRGMYEPYNVSRKLIGFDTYEGFATVDPKDGSLVRKGDYSTVSGYEKILEEILALHEEASPIPHLKKFELVKGDASQTIPVWLEENPHAVIAMAILDMDVYKPTKDVLEAIIPRLTKGSVLVFDELNCPLFPGETIAVQEVLGLNNLRIRRFPHMSYCAWAVFGED